MKILWFLLIKYKDLRLSRLDWEINGKSAVVNLVVFDLIN